MRRTLFYLSVALLAFGIGSFVVFKFYWMVDENSTVNETKNELKTQTNKKIEYSKANGNSFIFTQTNESFSNNDKPKTICSDKKLLPFWNELRKDKRFRERAKDFYMEADCSVMLEIQKIDLNNDGRKESVLWGKNGNLCGGTGNCDIWVYEKKNGKYKLLLQSGAYNDETKWLELKKAKSSNYQDILLKTHFSAAETVYEFYKFNGNKYIENKCLFYDYSLREEKSAILSCKERFKN
jgi:hypothetical protein